MVRTSKALPVALAVAGVAALLRLPGAFVPSLDRRAALGAAAAVAALAGQQSPAEAAQARFSVFGFDTDGRGAISDAYQQIDPDAISPYSQFSNPSKSTYTNDDAVKQAIINRQKGKVIDCVKRLDEVPELIRTKRSEDLKGLLGTRLGVLREAMEYLTTGGAPWYRTPEEKAAGMREANAFFQDLSDLGVAGRQFNWAAATEYYEKSKSNFKAWKDTTNAL